MSRGLQELEQLRVEYCVERFCPQEVDACKRCPIGIIEKELKALEIIVRNAKIVDYSEHNGIAGEELIIFQGFQIKDIEEYDLLKEVFNEKR